MGFGLFAAGVSLVVAPEYSERARSAADDLARLAGIQSGVLLLGGLVFFSLGVLSRGIAKASTSFRFSSSGSSKREDGADVSRAVERLAGDFAQLRNTVHQVSSDLGKTSQTLQRLVEAQEAGGLQGQRSDPSPDRQPLDEDPLFRLAASLDHMNARLDERLNALTAHVDERLANLRDLLEGGEEEAGGSPSRRDAGGAKQLEVLVSLEDDPEATHPSEFFDGVELEDEESGSSHQRGAGG